jgi:hypothetical protein
LCIVSADEGLARKTNVEHVALGICEHEIGVHRISQKYQNILFCTGEAEQIVLVQLERNTGGKFDGNAWNKPMLWPSKTSAVPHSDVSAGYA